MLAYVTMHLLNHAVGLISIAAMERVLAGSSGLVEPAGAGAALRRFLIHYALALWALWQRRTLRLRAGELTQIVLGFVIPILLVRHVVGNRVCADFFGTDDRLLRFRAVGLFRSLARSAASCRW